MIQIRFGNGSMNWCCLEQKLLPLPVYLLCPIYFDLTLDPNDPDEKYSAVIISISPI